jgi:hypothetical protein
MISKVISISEKVNSLSLFGRLLYTWMIPHADDFGRMPGSPAKVRALVVPMGDETVKDVETALADMHRGDLIIWYEVNGEKVIQITNFEEHQSGLHRRTASKYPPPRRLPDSDEPIALSALEADIEELIYVNLCQNTLFNEITVINAERQVRIQNSYLDIVATDEHQNKIIVEVKRQKLSLAAIDQIIKYRELLDKSAKCVLIGYGLAANFDLNKARSERINTLIYNDHLELSQTTLIDVNCCQLTLHSELNRTELELEQKRITTAATAREEEQSEIVQPETQRPDQEPFAAAYVRVYQRDLTPFQAQELGAYIDDEGFEEAVIVRAIERAAFKGGGIGLVTKILNDYAAGGAKSISAATAYDEHFEKGRERGGGGLPPGGERKNRLIDLRRRAEEERRREQSGGP